MIVPGKFWVRSKMWFLSIKSPENLKKIHSFTTNLSKLLKTVRSSNVEVSTIHLPVM